MKPKEGKWAQLASQKDIEEAVLQLEKRNITAEVYNNKEDALKRTVGIIPNGVSVMTGSSTTLDEIGFTDILKVNSYPWNNLKEAIVREKDENRQNDLRRESVRADYFLGSIHAVAKTGEVVVASATGSQLPAYIYTSPNVIWLVGTQKITSDLARALERVRDYVFPLEDERMKKEGSDGSIIGKLVIFEKEMIPGRIRLIFIKEKLGF